MKAEMANLALQLNGLRCEGNQLFTQSNYQEAVNLYTKCISECLDAMEEIRQSLECECGDVQQNGDHHSLAMRNTLLLAFTNRAESYLRLRNFKCAFADAERALELEPNNVKSLNRRGKALEGLQQYEKAHDSFSAAHKQAPHDYDIEKAMKRTKICVQQSQRGDYNLSDYYLGGCKGDIDPCCDYVGPVQISKVPEAGRGLILTKDVAAGELLVVSNALAVAFVLPEPSLLHQGLHYQSDRHEDEHLISKLTEVARNSPRAREQLYSLAYEKSQLEMEIPSMDLFRPGSDWLPCGNQAGKDVEVNPLRIWGVTLYSALNLYGHTADFSEYYDSEKARRRGLWPLPSFMNHSCFPNCLRMHIGKAMFVRAARHIRAGEELTINYFGVLDSLETRQESARQWGFNCKCPRCLFEQGIVALDKIGKVFHGLIHSRPSWQEDEENGGTPQISEEDLESLFRGVEDIVNRVNSEPEQKHWIVASCIYAYVAQAAILKNDPRRRIPILRVIVDSITSVSAANVWGLEYSCDLLREVGRLHGLSSEEYLRTKKRVIEIFQIAYGPQSSRGALETLVQYFHESVGAVHSCDRC